MMVSVSAICWMPHGKPLNSCTAGPAAIELVAGTDGSLARHSGAASVKGSRKTL
jgi:hypothetical protein